MNYYTDMVSFLNRQFVLSMGFLNFFGSVKQELILDPCQKHWNHDHALPIHSTPQNRLSTEETVRILLDSDVPKSRICTKQPTCVDKNSVYIVDLDQLKTPKDIACDDMGSWCLNGTYRSSFLITKKGNIIFSPKTLQSQYKLIRRYYFNKSSQDLHKTICTIQGMNY